MIDPDVVATVSFRCKGEASWDIDHLSRVIMALEMQRSFLLRAPVDVSVSIRTPTAKPLQLTHEAQPQAAEEAAA